MKPMKSEDYQETQNSLVMLAMAIVTIDLEEMINAIDLAETVGPFADPSLWIAGNKKMEQVKNLAKAALIFKNEAKKQMTEEKDGLVR